MTIRPIAIIALAQLLCAAAQSWAQQSCAPPRSGVAETDTVIRLTFGNGRQVTLIDVPPGDGQTDYRYRGYLSGIGYHLVELVVWGGPTSWYEIYNACTGAKLVVDAAPVISPDSTRFITLGHGVPRRPLVGRLQVWSRQPNGHFAIEWDFELGTWARDRGSLDWGPANARWLSETAVGLDRVDRDGRALGTARATREAGRWSFRVDP